MKRRTFLQTGTAACLTSCGEKSHAITGSIVGANAAAGHWLRDLKSPPAPTRTLKTDVVIAGSGISGLVAAFRLRQAGVEKITLLDLEAEPGGNARSGSNAISAYPWGAHYVPVPGADAVEVRRLFEELGVIIGHDAAGRPQYDETNLCSDPQERLFIHGVWQEGLGPNLGITAEERAEMDRFTAFMSGLRQKRGRDGRRLFTIPLDQSSRDAEWLALDGLTMEAWMQREGYHSRPLRWYVNYCCRDDYGAGVAQVSAWAGLHYFASRDEEDLLTWPAGNGYLVQELMKRLQGVEFQQAVVFRIAEDGADVSADGWLPATGECVRWQARAALCTMPRFVAQRVVAGIEPSPTLQYSPWVVANLTWQDRSPEAWDSVFYDSSSLGYVSATHQSLDLSLRGAVLTWYKPLDHAPPAQARQEALQKPWIAWRDEVLADLRPAHPEAERLISNLDVMLWGHGMIRPVPGFLWGREREKLAASQGRIAFAHTDMSGISLFEEACTRGAAAASLVGHWLDHA
jgi:putative NAD(P)-binding protein